jgi:hypothetical protein
MRGHVPRRTKDARPTHLAPLPAKPPIFFGKNYKKNRQNESFPLPK